jgi:hypothetical protein
MVAWLPAFLKTFPLCAMNLPPGRGCRPIVTVSVRPASSTQCTRTPLGTNRAKVRYRTRRCGQLIDSGCPETVVHRVPPT